MNHEIQYNTDYANSSTLTLLTCFVVIPMSADCCLSVSLSVCRIRGAILSRLPSCLIIAPWLHTQNFPLIAITCLVNRFEGLLKVICCHVLRLTTYVHTFAGNRTQENSNYFYDTSLVFTENIAN